MFENLYRLLYRDRRRLVFSGTLVVIATIIGHDTIPDPIPNLQIEFVAFALIMAAMPLVALYAPSYRYLVELMAMSNLTYVLLGKAFPASNFNPSSPDGSFHSSVVLYVLTTVAVHFITYGKWSDRFGGPKQVVSRARVTSKLALREVWFGLIPTPGHLDECADPDVVSIDYADRDKRTIRLITWIPGAPMGEVLLHVDKLETFKTARLTIDVRRGKRDPSTEGITEFHLSDTGHHRVLDVSHEMAQLPWRRALRGWLDDTLGRIMDVRLNATESVQKTGHVQDFKMGISPAEVMDTLCPREDERGMRRRGDLDAFTLTRNQKGVEDRLGASLSLKGKRG